MPRRHVKLQSGRHRSRISTPCNVRGAFSLKRTSDIDGKSRILKLLDLMPPKALFRNIIAYGSRDVVAYGLDDVMIRKFQLDEKFRLAATALLAHGSSLSLGERTLELTMGGCIPKDSRKELTTQIAETASLLETILGSKLNAEKSLRCLRRPGAWASVLAVVVFPFSAVFTRESINPFLLVPPAVVGWLLLSVAVFFVLRARLKDHALAGAVASEMIPLSVVSSLFLGFVASTFLNNYVGDILLTPQTFQVEGDVHIYHGKGTGCSLGIDPARPLIFNGHNFHSLPMPCSLANNQKDRKSEHFTVELNPGLLGAPFVKSLSPTDQSGRPYRD